VSRRAVFLDRDGVLIAARVVDGRPHPPGGLDEVETLPGVPEACEALHGAGLLLIVVTNQPDVARGSQEPEVVEAINDRLEAELGLDAVIVCPHDDDDGCECRKPLPGMILDAAERFDVELSRSVTVGDRWRDIEAGRAAGTRTLYIDRGYREPAPPKPDLVVGELNEGVKWIVESATR
jgi:D-glycero-D-manno-heptose 1,7-bisphosphate phosphatase